MVTSKRVTNAKSYKYQQKERGASEEKQKSKIPVGPLVLGFFLFVVVGSSILQIIRTATEGKSMVPP